MYQQNSVPSGAKWLFWLVIVILVAVFALGFNVKDAQWLNGKIASATAEQMTLATDIERQKSELALQVLRNETELQMSRASRQAEYEAAQQQQELDALILANTQKAQFRGGLYSTLNVGFLALMIAASLVLAALGINLSFGLPKLLNARAQVTPSVRASVAVQRHYHGPSLAAQHARQREQEERLKRIQAKRTNLIFKNSKAIWSADDGKADELIPGDYPWIG